MYQWGAKWIINWIKRSGPEFREQVLDVSRPTVKIQTGQFFGGNDEQQIRMSELRPYLPTLSAPLAARVDEFAARHFGGVVGLHIRRTDNHWSESGSPDELFLAAARRLLDEGQRIFLATDNAVTAELLRRFCGERLIMYPKQTEVAQRWPRLEFEPRACEDDLIDLFLLARTEYVLGSYHSSFTGTAIMLNGSPRSRVLSLDSVAGSPDLAAA